MTVAERWNQHIPEYYPSMHRDGYTPSEILTAVRQKLLQARQVQAEYPQNIHITVEIKVKKCGLTTQRRKSARKRNNKRNLNR